MLNENQAREVVGSTLYDSDGDKVGKVGQLFLDDTTGRPEFVTVNTGFFGSGESFVPVENATLEGGDLRVPFSKQQIKDAPNVDLDGRHLDEAEEQRLFEHYGMGSVYSSGRTDDAGEYANLRGTGTTHENTAGTEGYDTSGPTTDDAMTRSEEHLRVGTTEQEAGRARLRKYVTTETETATVPVRKERAVVETEPITDGNVGDALDGPAISEEEHEVVLHEERPVVSTEATPVERVRLGTEQVTEQETVTGEVREEHIEVEGDVDRR
jgi:uncharacterized protein (TIGR02271 family)